ncbi:MAG: SAM-dependent methyltransferase [Candidatus Actinomarina sp.]|jgi:SAM-dependent MidA family methyltransferase|nr:SAM-dependent methyltransferase [Candidatus Actinomarina sp.]
MDECLYSEFGFFNTTKVRSNKDGDFLTSPEVSEYFGFFIANFINENSIKKNILEIGAGTGSLASQVEKFSNKKPIVIEKSKTAFQFLKNNEFNVYKSIESVPNQEIDLIYMNEVLDNIPCAVALNVNNEWFEKIIRLEEDSLTYDLLPIREINLAWITNNNINPIEGIEIEIQRNSTEYLKNLISKFKPKYFIIFDYGYEFYERENKPYKSLIRTYKDHHLSGETILQPTSTDITYDVNFSSVESFLKIEDYTVKLTSQKEFIYQNGFEELYKEIQADFQKADGMHKLTLKTHLVGLEAINNNRGLGGFKVAVAKKL